MRKWIERQRNIIDFTIASLIRRKGKNILEFDEITQQVIDTLD